MKVKVKREQNVNERKGPSAVSLEPKESSIMRNQSCSSWSCMKLAYVSMGREFTEDVILARELA